MSKSKSSTSAGLALAAPRPPWGRVGLLVVIALTVALLSLFNGSADLGAGHTLRALLGGADLAARSIVIDLRLPRLLAGFAVGSLLALAGVLLQALFRNSLADPYVLGVSGGAAVGAIVAMSLGAVMALVQTAAVCGALVVMLGVYLLARGGSTGRLLLVGVAVASACGALVSVLVAAADPARLRGMVFWLAGDLEWAASPLASTVAALVCIAAAVLLARPLNVLAAGELRARSVGLEWERWRLAVYFATAIVTAIAVVSAGMIGFVGLITPHTVRLLFRTSDHRIVAPLSALLGGTLLAAADLIARTAASPRQLPVGAVTALVGAPMFIVLLRSAARGAWSSGLKG